MLTVFLCWVLCVANVIPTGMTVWASEAAVGNEPTAEEGTESDSALQDSQEEAAPEENEEADNEEAGQEPANPDDGDDSDENAGSGEDVEESQQPENTDTSEEEEGDVSEEPEEDMETDVPEENPEEGEIDGETAEEIDGGEDSLLSPTADLNADTIPADAIAGERYTENGSDVTWYIDKNGKLVVEGTGNFIARYLADQYRENIKTAQISVTGMTDASGMFSECNNLTSVDLSGLDTSRVTNMGSMFSGCESLTSLDVSGFDTSNVTDMSTMFWACESLTSLDVSGFDTSNVTDMGWMFMSCPSLTSLDVSGFDTSNVTNMGNMFDGCSSLTSLDVSGFDTSNVTYIGGMFWSCKSLTRLDVSNFDTSNVTDMGIMFDGCKSLTSLDVSGFNTSKVTDMGGMFDGCSSLTSLDVSGFDTSNVTDMYAMFYGCYNLTSLDVSNFDTSNVTDMYAMFESCKSLTRLDVSSFDTSNVTNMGSMFYECNRLKNLDVSGFDTSNVTSMSGMFYWCNSLMSLDLSSFDTSKVTSMGAMFMGCNSLTSLDVSSFDTSQVTWMSQMFEHCRSLTSLDVSNFDTSKVTNMHATFLNCKSLISLDLSSFDLGNVNEAELQGFLTGVSGLNTIYTPKNLHFAVKLENTWYKADGTALQELPQNLDHSIILTKKKSTAAITSSITATKKKKVYLCGETINLDDITVTYRNSKGEIIRLTTTDFTTNEAEIDMSVPGKKTLTVTYVEPETGKALKAEIELTVALLIGTDNIAVTLPTGESYVYNGYPHDPAPVVTLKKDGTVLKEGTDYKVSYTNNTNAGDQAAVTVEGIGDYSGKMTVSFTIEKAKVTIKAQDVTIAVDDEVPQTFAYDTAGFYGGDEKKVTGVSFSLADESGDPVSTIETSKEGVYQIIPNNAQVGDNYVVDADGYLPGFLTIAEERIAYTVTFDMMGHGTQTAAVRSVKAGSLVAEPEQPAAEGFLFTGWYKDRACTKAWNFAADTVQENTTLYARWAAQTAQGGVQIREIEDQTYTGSAIKPAVVVYGADGTLLKSGKDYTVKYVNNTLADQVQAEGGTYNSLDGGSQEGIQGRFDSRLPYVEIKGKGNHEGTVYKNFHIDPVSIADAGGGPAAGFTLKYTDQLVYNAKKDQKPFSSLKYKKAMKAGTDYTVTLRAVKAYDAADNNRAVGSWSAAGSKDNKWIPAIAKEYYGTFMLTISGQGNYTGVIRRTVYVDAKTSLIKNASITLGKNQKSRPYNDGNAVTLTPGYCDGKKYYEVDERGKWNSSSPAANGNDLFTVKSGKAYLVYGRDYTVTYANNKAVGTATMTVTGIGNYKGSKSVTFKIAGAAFKANTINVNGFNVSMPYSGSAITQNKVTLTDKAAGTPLVYGRHYTISYKNNIKKGTAAMTFTAKPESGYSGSFKKTFKIGAVSLDSESVKVEAAGSTENTQETLTSSKDEKGNTVYRLSGTIPYTREGVKPSKRICLRLSDGAGNVLLKEGTDYTVSYANNTVLASAGLSNKIPTMTFKGKGNYTGSVKVTFAIGEAAMEAGANNLTVTAAAAAFDSRKADGYQYAPKITVKDGKKTLGKKDYTVKYENCSQTEVKTYLDKLATLGMPDESTAQQDDDGDGGSTAWEELQKISPHAVITAVQGSGYTTTAGKEITVYLNIYETKLTGSNLYVVVSSEAAQTTYKGEQVMPEVTVYYGDAQTVKAAKKNAVTEEAKLTGSDYRLTKLTEKKEAAGDYTLTYGANLTAGKNKGTVTVSGAGKFGGSVTVKFDILSRNMWMK